MKVLINRIQQALFKLLTFSNWRMINVIRKEYIVTLHDKDAEQFMKKLRLCPSKNFIVIRREIRNLLYMTDDGKTNFK